MSSDDEKEFNIQMQNIIRKNIEAENINESLSIICEVLEFCLANIVIISRPKYTKIKEIVNRKIIEFIETIKEKEDLLERISIIRFCSISRELTIAYNIDSIDFSHFDMWSRE